MADIEIVIISLRGAIDRRNRVAEMLRASPWPWRFFDALSGAPSALTYDPERALVRRGYRLKPAELGCFGSHYECLREFCDSKGGPRYRLVVEDDVWVDLCFDFAALADLLRDLDIQYIRLYSRFMSRFRRVGRVEHRSLVRFVVPAFGTQAYMISKGGAQRFVRSISRIDRPVDDELDRYWINGLPSYALFPYPALELNVRSSIPKGFSEIDGLSPGQRLALYGFRWVERLKREASNFRFVDHDRVISRRLSRMRSDTHVSADGRTDSAG